MPFNSKLLMPVALGLSLVTVTAFVVYYIFKKEDEEEKDSDKRVLMTTRGNTIEVKVPKRVVPALIGRGGSNIKDIEKKSGAIINFKKFSDQDYDVCIIRGRSQNTQIAETLINDFLNKMPTLAEETIEVPTWACGKIIGTGGENVIAISHRSGARIKVLSAGSSDSPVRSVLIHGTKEQIENAKKLVKHSVALASCQRETSQPKRSPRHATAQSADQLDDLPGTKRTKYKPEASGASIEVYVSAVSSPSRFWVQLVGAQVTQLDALVDEMSDYYGSRENRANHELKHVSVGQVVAAVFRHDGRWYRARVVDIRPNEFDATQQVADVFFVDYGDSEYVATHELCELRADLLRLRFQAMECFLAGVKPAGREEEVVGVTAAGQRWDRWDPQAVERFEELTQVARWKPLVSRTCTYKKAATGDGDRDKEIPGIKLFDVTDEGELDIGAALVEEGWAAAVSASPRPSPPPAPPTPFGDLGNSMVLGMLSQGGGRSSSVPKDHKDDRSDAGTNHDNTETDQMTPSKSLSSGLESADKVKSISNFNISYPDPANQPRVNGSHQDFLNTERQNLDLESSTDTLVPKKSRDEIDRFKANMNRIDSHHSNLESLGRSEHDLHK